MRYTSSMIMAIIIALFTFLGMSLLIASPKYQKITTIEMTEFSKVSDMEKVNVKKPTPPKPLPKKEKIKQPPAPVKLDITQSTDRTAILPPLMKTNYKNNSLDQFELPLIPGINSSGEPAGKDGDLTQMFSIEPIYPIIALRNKTEGWVKVEFIVNEFGKVIKAKVIESKPRRVFDHATLKALRKSKFKPLIINGKAVSQKAVQVIEFKMNEY